MKPHISIIVARASNGVIGNEGKLPWKISEDLKFFKQVTMGRPVLMGRKTFESIGRPLPGRRNIIVTRNSEYKAQGVELASSFEEALSRFTPNDVVMVIGGAQLYNIALPKADTAWVTEIDGEFEGDAFFPSLDPYEWLCVWKEAHPATPKNKYGYTFKRFDRIRNLSF